jgi:hypothetical protein
LTVTGLAASDSISVWVKTGSISSTADLYNSTTIVGAGLGFASGTPLYQYGSPRVNTPFYRTGSFSVVVTHGTEVRYGNTVAFTRGSATVSWAALNSNDPGGPVDPPLGTGDGTLTVTGIPPVNTVFALVIYGTISSRAELNTANYIAAGLGPHEGVPLFDATTSQRFGADGSGGNGNGTYTVVVTSGDETRYKTNQAFTNGSATVHWTNDLISIDPPPGTPNGTLTVTGNPPPASPPPANNVIAQVFSTGTITTKDDVTTKVPVAGGAGPKESILLEVASGPFEGTGNYTVVVSVLSGGILTSKYKPSHPFTNGIATVNWDTDLVDIPSTPPPPPDEAAIYVASYGKDSNSGTRASPKLTLSTAVILAIGTSHRKVIVVDSLWNTKGSNADTKSVFNISTGYPSTEVTIKGYTANSSLYGYNGRRALYVYGATKIRIENLTIKEGYLDGNGGGLGVGAGATVTLGSGAVIYGNTARRGGGIGIDGSTSKVTTVIMEKGSKVTYNTSFSTADGGGGVYVHNGHLQMNDGEISSNTSYPNDGGGVYLDEHAWLTMYNGLITKNACAETGGGVCVSKGTSTFNMSGGEISLNRTTGTGPTPSHASGGGVAVETTGKFNKTGGLVYGTNHSAKTNWSALGYSHSYAWDETPNSKQYLNTTF